MQMKDKRGCRNGLNRFIFNTLEVAFCRYGKSASLFDMSNEKRKVSKRKTAGTFVYDHKKVRLPMTVTDGLQITR